MNVVSLVEARTKRQMRRLNDWTSHEVAELARLYRAKTERGAGVSFATGATDLDDPQFYILNDEDNQSCSVCVSRLRRHGRSWYVVEDGNGRIEGEGGCLRTLVTEFTRRSFTRWRALIPVLAYCAQQLFGVGADSQEVALAAEYLLAFA
jgi:hypothetical protein